MPNCSAALLRTLVGDATFEWFDLDGVGIERDQLVERSAGDFGGNRGLDAFFESLFGQFRVAEGLHEFEDVSLDGGPGVGVVGRIVGWGGVLTVRGRQGTRPRRTYDRGCASRRTSRRSDSPCLLSESRVPAGRTFGDGDPTAAGSGRAF